MVQVDAAAAAVRIGGAGGCDVVTHYVSDKRIELELRIRGWSVV